jgi:hypothetical protein
MSSPLEPAFIPRMLVMVCANLLQSNYIESILYNRYARGGVKQKSKLLTTIVTNFERNSDKLELDNILAFCLLSILPILTCAKCIHLLKEFAVIPISDIHSLPTQRRAQFVHSQPSRQDGLCSFQVGTLQEKNTKAKKEGNASTIRGHPSVNYIMRIPPCTAHEHHAYMCDKPRAHILTVCISGSRMSVRSSEGSLRRSTGEVEVRRVSGMFAGGGDRGKEQFAGTHLLRCQLCCNRAQVGVVAAPISEHTPHTSLGA